MCPSLSFSSPSPCLTLPPATSLLLPPAPTSSLLILFAPWLLYCFFFFCNRSDALSLRLLLVNPRNFLNRYSFLGVFTQNFSSSRLLLLSLLCFTPWSFPQLYSCPATLFLTSSTVGPSAFYHSTSGTRGCSVAGVNPRCPGTKAGLHPGQFASLSQGHIETLPTIHTHAYRRFRVSPVHLV